MKLSAAQQAFYTQPGPMTDPGAEAALIADAPGDVAGIVRYVQNLVLHMHLAPAYQVQHGDDRRGDAHVRTLARMLERMHHHGHGPLDNVRQLEQRMIGVCRHFTTLSVALLRRRGVPARARVGFAAYFDDKMAVDHWVTEYWTGDRWQLFDAQIDDLQRAMFAIRFDTLDVPRDQFVTAASAWMQCRAGEADPDRFGIMQMHGLWFIAGNVLRDLAALNNMEMLPWDVWGPMVMADDQLTPATLALFDRLTALTLDPDPHFAELRAAYQNDPTLRVPPRVFNAERQRMETV